MARSFNGTTDFIAVPGLLLTTIAPLSTTAKPFSIATWVNPTAGIGGNPLVIGGATSANGSTNNLVLFGYKTGSTGLSWETFVNSGNATGSATNTAGVWSHQACTYNGNTTTGLIHYSNGVAGSAQTGTVGTGSLGSATDIITVAEGVSGNNFWKGPIADVAIWSCPLSPAEVLALANRVLIPGQIRPRSLLMWHRYDGYNHAAFDYSGRGNLGVLTGTTFAVGPPLLSPNPIQPATLNKKTPATVSTIKFRKTLSQLGGRVGSRQIQGWSA